MLQPDEIKRKSVRGAISFILRTLLMQGIAFVATVLLGKYLSPEEFGVYFIVVSAVSMFTFLSDIGLAAALIQKHEEPTLEELRTTFTVQQFLAVVIFIIIILLTPVWIWMKGFNQEALFLLYALGFSFVLASFKTIPSILLERKLEFGKIVLPQIVENIAFYGIAVFFARQHYGVSSYTYAVLVRAIVGVLVIYVLQPWGIGIAFSKKAFLYLKSFGVRFQLNDLLARVKDDLLVVVLGSWLPTYQMGLVSWSKRWSLFPYQLSVQSILSVMFSTLSRLQKEPAMLQRAVEKSIFFISLMIFPILAGLCVMAYPFTVVIPEYAKWQPALPSLYLFCINIVFAAVANPIIHALNAIGKVHETLKMMMWWTGLSWILTIFFVFTIGFHGAALASVFVAAASLYALFVLKKDVQIRFIEQIWRQTLATIIMVGALLVAWRFVSISYLTILLFTVMGACVYGISMLLLGFAKVKTELLSLRKMSAHG